MTFLRPLRQLQHEFCEMLAKLMAIKPMERNLIVPSFIKRKIILHFVMSIGLRLFGTRSL